jgi:hypothetical protein
MAAVLLELCPGRVKVSYAETCAWVKMHPSSLTLWNVAYVLLPLNVQAGPEPGPRQGQ